MPDGFENFDRPRKVEDGLGAGTNDSHRGAGERSKIGGDVEGVFAASMRTANPAGGNNVYAYSSGDEESGGDGGGARPAGGEDGGKIGAAGLDHLRGFGDTDDLLFGETYDEQSVEDCNGCRECASFANDNFHLESRVEIVRPGEPVRDYRGFQRNYGCADSQRSGDVGADRNERIHTTSGLNLGLTTNAR